MKEADGIILASPVYTANLSANMQAFLERASVVTDMNRNAELFRHKVGAAAFRLITGDVCGWFLLLAHGLRADGRRRSK